MIKPIAIVGDVIIGDTHPDNRGVVMFKVASAGYDGMGHWVYSDGENLKVNELWVSKVYKSKYIKR